MNTLKSSLRCKKLHFNNLNLDFNDNHINIIFNVINRPYNVIKNKNKINNNFLININNLNKLSSTRIFYLINSVRLTFNSYKTIVAYLKLTVKFFPNHYSNLAKNQYLAKISYKDVQPNLRF